MAAEWPLAGLGQQRGFAAMTEKQRREVASRGGKRAHELGTAASLSENHIRKVSVRQIIPTVFFVQFLDRNQASDAHRGRLSKNRCLPSGSQAPFAAEPFRSRSDSFRFCPLVL
jgi:hypothetical protein